LRENDVFQIKVSVLLLTRIFRFHCDHKPDQDDLKKRF